MLMLLVVGDEGWFSDLVKMKMTTTDILMESYMCDLSLIDHFLVLFLLHKSRRLPIL